MSGTVYANRRAAKGLLLLLAGSIILSGNGCRSMKEVAGKPSETYVANSEITIVANSSEGGATVYQWSYANKDYQLARTLGICDAQVFEHRHNHLGMGDINGDGQDDLVIGTNDGVYMIDGDSPTFCRQVIESEMPRRSPWFIVATGDYDGDGMDEIIYAHRTSVSIYGWDENSLQKEDEINIRAIQVGLADMDADGKPEILLKKVPDTICIFTHSQGKCVLKAELPKSSDWRGFGRGISDVSPQEPGSVEISSASQPDASVFPVIKTTFQHYDSLDYNADSYLDIAVCGMGGVQIITNRAGNKYEAAGFVGDISGFGPHLTVCDIDYDGKEDLVVSSNDDIIVLGVDQDGVLGRKFTNSGDQDSTISSVAQAGPTWPPSGPLTLPRFRHMKFFDTDGDGKGELVTPENTGGNQWRVVVWKYDGGATPRLKRAWSSAEPIYGFPWIVEGPLSQKIQDRLERLE